MGEMVNSSLMKYSGQVIAVLVISLNGYLLIASTSGC
jgi:Mn2+/Fe2+ NRAMP family transporter